MLIKITNISEISKRLNENFYLYREVEEFLKSNGYEADTNLVLNFFELLKKVEYNNVPKDLFLPGKISHQTFIDAVNEILDDYNISWNNYNKKYCIENQSNFANQFIKFITDKE